MLVSCAAAKFSTLSVLYSLSYVARSLESGLYVPVMCRGLCSSVPVSLMKGDVAGDVRRSKSVSISPPLAIEVRNSIIAWSSNPGGVCSVACCIPEGPATSLSGGCVSTDGGVRH